MAANTVLSTGAGGDTIRGVDKGGVKTQVVLLDVGAAGAESLFSVGQQLAVSSFSVVLASDQAVIPVSLPAGFATSALQSTGNASLVSIDAKLTSPLTVNVGLTDAQLRASAVPVSGTVAVNVISGFATSGLQTTGNTSLASIDTKLTNPLPVSAASLPLPTGASTDALQTAGNASLTTIAAKDFSTETTLALLRSLLNITPGASSASINGPMVQGLVDDNLSSYLDSTIRPLSLTNDGRLRVVNVPALADLSFVDEKNSPPYTDFPSFIESPWASSFW